MMKTTTECDEQARRANEIKEMTDKVKLATNHYVHAQAMSQLFYVSISEDEALTLILHADQWTLFESSVGIVLEPRGFLTEEAIRTD